MRPLEPACEREPVSPCHQPARRTAMQWTDPAFCDIRLGFEVTAYVYVR
jgi:coenzyme PQQ precursor peptide PqqA